MPKFGKRSKERLETCHVDLQILFNEVVKHVDCIVLEGHRGKAAQDLAFGSGNSKLKWPHGKHNAIPSLAVDVAPYPIPAWAKTQDFIYFGGFVMGIAAMLQDAGVITHAIRYGGDWSRDARVSNESFLDLVHYEILGD